MILIIEGPNTDKALQNCYKYLMDLRRKELLEEQLQKETQDKT